MASRAVLLLLVLLLPDLVLLSLEVLLLGVWGVLPPRLVRLLLARAPRPQLSLLLLRDTVLLAV